MDNELPEPYYDAVDLYIEAGVLLDRAFGSESPSDALALLEKAEIKITDALSILPNWVEALLTRANILIQREEQFEARHTLVHILELTDNKVSDVLILESETTGDSIELARANARTRSYWLLGYLLIQTGAPDLAIPNLEQAVKEGQNADPQLLEDAYDTLANAWRESGNLGKAWEVVEAGIAALRVRGITEFTLLDTPFGSREE